MESSNVYVTIGLDKEGKVVEVRVDGRPVEPKQGPPGLPRRAQAYPGAKKWWKDWCTSC